MRHAAFYRYTGPDEHWRRWGMGFHVYETPEGQCFRVDTNEEVIIDPRNYTREELGRIKNILLAIQLWWWGW
jgi:hypothetical protein